jgi:hypothetical protein
MNYTQAKIGKLTQINYQNNPQARLKGANRLKAFA